MANSMPYSLEAEQSVLACIMLDQIVQVEIISQLKEDDFLVTSHKTIFSYMHEIMADSKPVDLVTLSDILQKNGKLDSVGGIAYLTELTKVVPSAANYAQYLSIVKRDGVLRRLIHSSNLIIEDSTKSTDSAESLAYAEKLIFDIANIDEKHNLERISQYFDPVVEKFEKLQKDKNYFTGLKTGFTELDYITNGFHCGNLIILAARPSVGKTTLAMNIVENVATQRDAVCAVFELEMTKVELAQRMLCSYGNIPMDAAMKGKLTETDEQGFKKLWQAKKALNEAKIYVDESSNITPQDILNRARRLKMKQGGKLDLIVVDHMQLMQSAKKAESRQQEVTEISRNLKMVAKELDCPVLALSQLSRQITSRKGGRPVLSDLRESGAIEQDADLVIFLHKPEADTGKRPEVEDTEIIVAKNRNGPCKDFKLRFRGNECKFVNIDDKVGDAPKHETKFSDARDNKPSPELEKISKDEIDSLENNAPQEGDTIDDVFDS